MGTFVVIFTIVGTLVLCGAVAWFFLSKAKKDAYSGTVVDKRTEERESSDSSYTVYHLLVKLTDGTQKDITVSRKLYEQFTVGDAIVKEAGKFNPAKA